MPRREEISEVYLKKESAIRRAISGAIKNAYEVGTGFVVIRRLNRGSDVIIEEMLWHEVDQVLKDMGVRGTIFNE